VLDAEASVELTLRAASTHQPRQVRVQAGEVRRVRLELWLPGGVEPLSLQIQCVLSGAPRIRPSWVRVAEPGPSTGGVLRSALRQALGRQVKPDAPVAPESAAIPLVLEALGGELPVAAADEAMWQPGMAIPASRGLRAEVGRPMSLAPLADATGERPECRNCFTRQYLEVVRAMQSCPTCGHRWDL
jgi:hypothetical protein